MRIIFLFVVFFFSFCFVFQVQSTNIGTIKLDYILNKTNSYILFINEIEEYKKLIENKIKVKENILIEENNEIENSSLILNDAEINKRILIHQEKLSRFQDEINEYNKIIKDNIDKNRSKIIRRIAQISRDIATKENLHIILTENSYLLSSEDIDISNKVIELINLENIKLDFVK